MSSVLLEPFTSNRYMSFANNANFIVTIERDPGDLKPDWPFMLPGTSFEFEGVIYKVIEAVRVHGKNERSFNVEVAHKYFVQEVKI